MPNNLRRYDSVVIDGRHYIARDEVPLDVEALKLLCEVYSVLWTEAYYDPTNEHTGKFAKPLADKMAATNKLLGFRQ